MKSLLLVLLISIAISQVLSDDVDYKTLAGKIRDAAENSSNQTELAVYVEPILEQLRSGTVSLPEPCSLRFLYRKLAIIGIGTLFRLLDVGFTVAFYIQLFRLFWYLFGDLIVNTISAQISAVVDAGLGFLYSFLFNLFSGRYLFLGLYSLVSTLVIYAAYGSGIILGIIPTIFIGFFRLLPASWGRALGSALQSIIRGAYFVFDVTGIATVTSYIAQGVASIGRGIWSFLVVVGNVIGVGLSNIGRGLFTVGGWVWGGFSWLGRIVRSNLNNIYEFYMDIWYFTLDEQIFRPSAGSNSSSIWDVFNNVANAISPTTTTPAPPTAPPPPPEISTWRWIWNGVKYPFVQVGELFSSSEAAPMVQPTPATPPPTLAPPTRPTPETPAPNVFEWLLQGFSFA